MAEISALTLYCWRSRSSVSISSSLTCRSRSRWAGEKVDRSASSRSSAQVRGCTGAASIRGVSSRRLKVTSGLKAGWVWSASLIRVAAVAAPAMIPKSHKRSQIRRAEASLSSVERPLTREHEQNKTPHGFSSSSEVAGGVLENLRYQRCLGESGAQKGGLGTNTLPRPTQKRTPGPMIACPRAAATRVR